MGSSQEGVVTVKKKKRKMKKTKTMPIGGESLDSSNEKLSKMKRKINQNSKDGSVKRDDNGPKELAWSGAVTRPHEMDDE